MLRTFYCVICTLQKQAFRKIVKGVNVVIVVEYYLSILIAPLPLHAAEYILMKVKEINSPSPNVGHNSSTCLIVSMDDTTGLGQSLLNPSISADFRVPSTIR